MTEARAARKVVRISLLVAALATSCVLPAYNIQGTGNSGNTSGSGGATASSGSSIGSGDAGGASGVGGNGGAGGAGGAGGGVTCGGADGSSELCAPGSADGMPCDCAKDKDCVTDTCSLGSPPAHLKCNPKTNKWTATVENLQCCSDLAKPCRRDTGEVCVVRSDKDGTSHASCEKDPCAGMPIGEGQCNDCAAKLCKSGKEPICSIQDESIHCDL